MEVEVTEERTEPFVAPVRREKKAKRSVLIADKAADRIITIGGIFVIIAVLGILVFLVEEVLPLFTGGTVTDRHHYRIQLPSEGILSTAIDEYKTFAFMLLEDGAVELVHVRSGFRMSPPNVELQGPAVTSFSRTLDRQNMLLGFADGTVRFVKIKFPYRIIPLENLPEGLMRVDERDLTDGSAVYSQIPGNQYRKIWAESEVDQPVRVSDAGTPLVALDYRVSGEAERQTRAFVTVDGAGQTTLNIASTKINLLTGKKRTEISKIQLPPLPGEIDLHSVLLTEKGDTVLIADTSGTVYRYNTSRLHSPMLAEMTRLLPPGAELTVFGFLLGGDSLVVAGSDGSLNIYFLLEREDATTRDGQVLVRSRSFGSVQETVSAFSPSSRGKSFAVACPSGKLSVLHGTSQKTLMSFLPENPSAYLDVLLAPRADGLMAVQTDGTTHFWEFSLPHPETTFRTLFQKVWYEGYPEPTFTWQSSAATQDYESKFSLVPLIFGTVKGAFYSLLFAIPVAILSAIYTSEFVHRRVRAFMKPTMEMMASLPSVVLGFVAALVLAPVVETWVAAVVLAFVALPLALMVAAYLWQLLPARLAIRLQGIPKFALMFAVVLSALYGSYALGPAFESLFFGGDFKAWLDGRQGGAEPFLFLLCAPVGFLAAAVLVSRLVGRRLSLRMRRLTHFRAAVVDIGRWMAIATLGGAGAFGISQLLGLLGADPRGTFIDTYEQRNSLVVGFAMGFAVIPIIYTIAEDALNAVPEHLRAASLACGATPWQTAIHVVLPTAVSGVFSAIMIGMGRAVGETMIVVMAAGNTPLIDWNVFNGLRALSATIAVELPEAVKDGTLYRILFLAGLVLFTMTFVINTVAEMVRLRFRRRTLQL